jgi:protein SCO1/2
MNVETRRRFRWTDWPVLAIAGVSALLAILVVIYFTTGPTTTRTSENQFAEFARNIDDVALTDSNGAALRWADLNGKPRLVFFGFTRCPEICPTTVAELSAAIDEIGDDAGSLEVDFVSVDPARDTPEHLAAYFSSFGPRFRGLTGDRAEIDRLVHSFRAAYEYVPTNGDDYTVNHTAITYLVNPRGEVVDIIGYGNPHERTIAQLRAFLS